MAMAAGTKKSPRLTTKDRTGKGKSDKPRAHRDDTTEARQQKAATPKTHPTRNARAARKDK